MAGSSLHPSVQIIAYGLLNIVSAVLIVVANKVVLYTCRFSFPVALTWLHTIMTAVGLQLMALLGIFTIKRLPWDKTAPNAVAYVGYIVFNNISIQLNTLR
jgi:solute carrier family 35 protein E3